jgi:hypothetical protein
MRQSQGIGIASVTLDPTLLAAIDRRHNGQTVTRSGGAAGVQFGA